MKDIFAVSPFFPCNPRHLSLIGLPIGFGPEDLMIFIISKKIRWRWI